MLDLVLKYGAVALTVLGGLVTILAVISPLTKSDVDNKILAGLRKLQEVIASLLGIKAAK